MNQLVLDEKVYQAFCRFLESECGIVLGYDKLYLVNSRLQPLVEEFQFSSLEMLITQLLTHQNNRLKIAVTDAMTTNETLWFRDGYPFEILKKEILPHLAATQKNIKIWSAASSSGQEPYSIAMVVQELKQKNPLLFSSVSITATDISTSMLAKCRAGEFDAFALNRGLSPERLQNFFDDVGDNKKKIKEELKQMILFRQQNLLKSYAGLGKFDVIFCRNVLIYFSAEMKVNVISQLANSLHIGGYLFLGAPESIVGLKDKFVMRRFSPGIAYQRI